MRFIPAIRRLVSRPPAPPELTEEDRLWNDWLDLYESAPDAASLARLLESDVRREFKIRALVVLLAPDLRVLPFRWRQQEHEVREFVSSHDLKVETLPQDLLHFACDLLLQNMQSIRDRQDMRSQGVFQEVLIGYNGLILKFLKILPANDPLAKRLFDCYPIHDPVPFMDMMESSGYNPLHDILIAQNVPLRWKYLADRQMRVRIMAELEGRARPRAEWETALACYVRIMQQTDRENTGYSRTLLASQLSFVVGLPGIEEYPERLLQSRGLLPLLEALSGSSHAPARHKLARLVVFQKVRGRQSFAVWDSETKIAAQRMLLEFAKEDPELGERLRSQILEYRAEEYRKAEKKLKLRQKVAALLDRMK